MDQPTDDLVDVNEMFPTAEEGKLLVREIADSDSFRSLLEKLATALQGHTIHEMCLAFSEVMLVVLNTMRMPNPATVVTVAEDAADLLHHLILEEEYAPEEVIQFAASLLTHHVCVAEHNFKKFGGEGGAPPGVTVN